MFEDDSHEVVRNKRETLCTLNPLSPWVGSSGYHEKTQLSALNNRNCALIIWRLEVQNQDASMVGFCLIFLFF